MIRVLVVDDHKLVRAGIGQLLAETDDIEVVGEAGDGHEALEAVALLHPDVVLMDLSMPRVDGRTATERIHRAHPDVRVVMLSSFSDREDVRRTLDAGAVGYLLKDSPPAELLIGIRAAVRDEPHAVPDVLLPRPGTDDTGDLTTREMDVLVLLADGLPNKVIATRLGISEKTVKAHITHIFQALGVSDRTQAALWVDRHGLSPHWQSRREQLRARPRGA
jgi:DNA-binding NarL/FixJ family response regulator